MRKALRLNQNAGYLYNLLLGRAYFFIGRYELALINLREFLARDLLIDAIPLQLIPV